MGALEKYVTKNPYFSPLLLSFLNLLKLDRFYLTATLNAKQHEKEANIIAEAGKINAVTIATKMAGRGTDIKLGGNKDFIFEGKKAIGIEVKIKNKVEKVYAEKEVILSGGSINSPQLLMLSGIGDKDHLKEKGINVVNDVKGVGKNLQDHLETYIMQEVQLHGF